MPTPQETRRGKPNDNALSRLAEAFLLYAAEHGMGILQQRANPPGQIQIRAE